MDINIWRRITIYVELWQVKDKSLEEVLADDSLINTFKQVEYQTKFKYLYKNRDIKKVCDVPLKFTHYIVVLGKDYQPYKYWRVPKRYINKNNEDVHVTSF